MFENIVVCLYAKLAVGDKSDERKSNHAVHDLREQFNVLGFVEVVYNAFQRYCVIVQHSYKCQDGFVCVKS